MKNILITGGLGHIGSRLCEYLLNNNFKIICLDNFMTQRYSSLKGLIKNVNFSFHEIDVAIDPKSLINVIESNNCDIIIHLAAKTNAVASFENKEELMNNNFNSTKYIVDICQTNGIRLIYPSSTSVYGSADKVVDETNKDHLNPQSPYAESKILEEDYIIKNLNQNYYILRLGTIFGVSNGMRFHTAVNKFCYQAVMGLPITVWETAIDQYRPYLEILDACRAIEFFIKNDKEHGVYNINSFNLTVREIIKEIENNTDKLEIKFVKNKIMNQLSYFVSNEKAINSGFKFRGSLKDSIADTFRWFN